MLNQDMRKMITGLTENERRHSEDLESVFENIFRLHQQQLYQVAFKVTKNHQQAADIVQDVFLKYWECRFQWDDIQRPEAWLHRVLKNRLIDFLRKASANQRMLDKLWKRIQDPQPTPVYQQLDLKESTAMLEKVVDELPPQRKMVYRMSRDLGLNYQEIADELSISRHTVKNQLSLALRFLQKKFFLE